MSHTNLQPRKRKHSDSSQDEQLEELDTDPGALPRMKPLSVQPIDNEFDELDEGRQQDGEEDEDQEDEQASSLKKQEYLDILNAQESTTRTTDGDIKITPFNLEEELEEGKFDVAGNYIFDREKKDEENNDAWAESVDWAAVEKKAKEEEQKRKLAMEVEDDDDTDQSGDTGSQTLDKIGSYKKMLRLMRPDETVQKTIKRLVDAMPKRTRPLKGNKASHAQSSQTSQPELASDLAELRAKLDLMIELAHQSLEEGEVNIYQMSYEDLEEIINR